MAVGGIDDQLREQIWQLESELAAVISLPYVTETQRTALRARLRQIKEKAGIVND